MLLTPDKLPGIKTELCAYFLRGIEAPWPIASAGRERRFTARDLQGALTWVSQMQAQRQNVGVGLDRSRFIVLTAPAGFRPGEMSLPPTHIVLAGKLWCVWRIEAPITPDDHRAIVAALIRQIRGGAPAQTPLPLPGTVHSETSGLRLVGRWPVQMLPPAPYSYRFVDGRLARPQMVARTEAVTLRADQIKPSAIEWLWQGVIPLGSMTLLAGAAGMGKSQVALSVAAKVSRDGGAALVFEAEDDAASVVMPRLQAAGADLRRVGIGTLLDLSPGIAALTAEAKRMGGVRLVVLSPIRAFFKAAEDQGNAGLRKALAPLLTWAAQNRAAILGIGHPPKGKRDPFAGSAAYVEVARAAWSVVSDPDDDNPIKRARRRMLVSEKANLGPDTGAIAYRIEGVTLPGGIETSKVIWC